MWGTTSRPTTEIWWLFIAMKTATGTSLGMSVSAEGLKEPTPRKAAECAPGDTAKHQGLTNREYI